MIEYVSFHKVPKVDSLIGYCSFKFNKDFSFTEIAVHKLKIPKNNIRIRLRYPERCAPSKETQTLIDEEVNAYILANYREIFDENAN